MRKFLVLFAALALSAAEARADAIVVGTAIADHGGKAVLDLQIDGNADSVFVKDQLTSNLELSDGSIQSVDIEKEKGLAHVNVQGAAPDSTIQASLSNDVAASTGVGPSPAGVETRRRAFWLFGGLGALAANGSDHGNPQAPLAEEPPPPPATPTPAPPASTGP
jgi:hypothetical protein